MAAHAVHLPELLLRALARRDADQNHEDRHQRCGGGQNQAGRPVERKHHAQQHQRNQPREACLRAEVGVVAVQ
ncbi:MAG TPA: hypothetical protein DD407_09220 [Pseudohongiella sp.]|nr:hypothetical protein [Pseudohongiella sp.]